MRPVPSGAGGAQQAPPGVSTAAPTRAQARAPGVDGDAARRSLATLPVTGRAPRTGYAREQFGPAWADVDRNGCDTRNDILRRDLTGVVLKEGTTGCVVMRGVLGDPYSGRLVSFQRGDRT